MKGFYPAAQGLNFVLLYGSQLGQAKSIAENLADSADEHGLKTKVFALNDVTDLTDLKKLDVPIVIVTSTTGDGDPPENADKFWRKIRRKNLDSKTLLCLRYTILGLGDTNFNNFCNCGKTIHQRLQELGATLFYAPGWADDAVGIELVVDDWIQGLWSAVRRACGIAKLPFNSYSNTDTVIATESVRSYSSTTEMANTAPIGSKLTEAAGDARAPATTTLTIPPLPVVSLQVECKPEGEGKLDLLDPVAPYPLIDGSPCKAVLADVNILTKPGALKLTLEITLKIENDLEFLPGDAISIVSPNNSSEVDAILRRLKLDDKATDVAEVTLRKDVAKAKMPVHVPAKAIVRDLLTYICDIRQPAKKAFLRLMAEFTSNEEEKTRILELCSKQGSALYSNNILEPGASLLDFLLQYPSCLPPFHVVLEHLPRLQPRPYSISSSPLVSLKEFKMAFNIIQIPKEEPRKYSRLGVCTGYLLDLCKKKFPGKFQEIHELVPTDSEYFSESNELPREVVIFKRKNQHFHPPTEIDKPMVMIGPGTGIAPFVGFIQHRQLQKKEDPTIEIGDYVLYFGCRNEATDYLYKNDLAEYVKDSVLSKLYVAFSRDSRDDGVKYVQDLMLQNQKEIVGYLDEGGYFYVCGDAKNMAKDVREALMKCYENVKGVDSKDAIAIVSSLVASKRYLQDVWA